MNKLSIKLMNRKNKRQMFTSSPILERLEAFLGEVGFLFLLEIPETMIVGE